MIWKSAGLMQWWSEANMSEKFKVEINLDGAAFHPRNYVEVARILRDLAMRVEGYMADAFILQDINGNSVGVASFKGGGR